MKLHKAVRSYPNRITRQIERVTKEYRSMLIENGADPKAAARWSPSNALQCRFYREAVHSGGDR